MALFVEQYLVSIYEVDTQETHYILIPNNRDFAILLGNLDSNKYIILTVTPLSNFIDFDEFLSKIMKKNKPDNLHFGKKE